MKKLFKITVPALLLLFALCLLHQPAQAAAHEDFSYVLYTKPTYTEGYYDYVVESGEAYIVKVDRSISGHVTIPSQLGGYPVTFVYGGSFRYCAEVTEVTFPDSVITIGFNCFEECTGLVKANIGPNVKKMIGRTFAGCTSLTTVNWGGQLTHIGRENFYGCTSLTSITIPDTVTEIGTKMFYNCKNLETVQLSKNLTVIPQQTFENCEKLKTFIVPDSVETVDRYVFEDCTSLGSVVIGSSVKNIEMYAFSGCTSLTTVAMNSCVELIGKYAFQNCEKLQAITIPDTTTDIGDYAFSGCKSMTTATIGNSVQRIGVCAFEDCKALKAIVIPDSVTLIERYAFSGCSAMKTAKIGENVEKIDFGGFEFCAALEEIVIPDSVTGISDGVFQGCSGAKKAIIGKGVTALPKKAFYGCAGLETVTISKNVTSIGEQVFTECSGMQKYIVAEDSEYFSNDSRGVLLNKAQTALIQAPGSISGKYVMPETVTTIGDYAFFKCGKLTEIVFADGVKHIGNQCFIYCSNLEHVDYGESLETAGSFCFGYCEKLTEINLPATFKSISGLMYDGCNGLVHVVLPDSVEVIGPEAFAFCTNLKSIDLGNGIREIQRSAFQHCGNLTAITAGENLALIADMAFNYCDDLKDVYFRGTNAQWCDVEIVNYYPGNYNGYLINAQLHLLGEHEHKYSKYVKDNNATCTTDGTETATCSICGDRKSRAIKGTALGHTGGAATCASPAICTRCGEPYGNADESKHSGTELIYSQTVGYTHDGYKEYRCDICGGSYITDIVKAKGLPKPTVKVTNDALTGSIILSWTHDGEAEYYAIYRATSKSGKYTLVDTVEVATWQDATVAAGKTYYYKVEACTEIADYNSGYSSVVTGNGICSIPELTVTAGSTGKPVLTWNKITGAKKYEIWRSVDGGAFKKLTTGTKLTYTDTKATAGAECTYKVKALGSKSSYNGEFSSTGSCYVTCAAPSLTLKLDSKTGIPALSWKKITGAKSYAIYRSANGGEYQLLTTTTAVSYKDSTVQADNKYSYYVITVGKAEVFNSVASAAKGVTLAVKAPKLSGSANANGKPVLSWTAPENAVAYEVYRSTKSGKGFELIATVTDLSYTDPTVATGKTFYYKVIAVGANTESTMSSYLKMVGKCATPAIQVVLDEDSGKPIISWEKIEGAKKYTVYRATSETGKYSKLGTSTKLTYTDTKATVGTKYFYKIVANPSSGSANSNYSNIESCLCICAKAVITAKVDTASGKPSLSWKKVTGAKTYAIYRSENGGEYILVATQTAVSYKDTTAVAGNAYSYQVKVIASKTGADSLPSAEKTVIATCAQPKVKGKVGATGKPELTWGEVEGATKYVIYRSTGKSKGYTVLTETEDLTYTDATAVKGKTYYYKVVAVCNDLESAQSAYVKVKSK